MVVITNITAPTTAKISPNGVKNKPKILFCQSQYDFGRIPKKPSLDLPNREDAMSMSWCSSADMVQEAMVITSPVTNATNPATKNMKPMANDSAHSCSGCEMYGLRARSNTIKHRKTTSHIPEAVQLTFFTVLTDIFAMPGSSCSSVNRSL